MKNLIKTFILIVSLCFAASNAWSQYDAKTRTLNITPYVTPGADCSKAVQRALKDCQRLGARKLYFPKNTYYFRPDSLEQFMTYVSNHGDYMRCFAFDLTGIHNLEIDGDGSMFLFKGYVCPFYVNKASGITLRNFTVDFVRSFHSEGHIVEVTPDYIDVTFSKEYPYYVDDKGHLRMTDDEGVEYPWYYLLEFDTQRRETAYMVGDQWTGSSLPVIDMGQGRVRLNKPGLRGKVGNVFNFGIAYRKVPCITVSDSKDFALHNVTLYHAGGMGVIAQRSKNILLDHLTITPAPGKDRVVSVAADATHFVNCSGYLKMYDCRLQNQTDDASNIHGVYYRVADVMTDNRIMVELSNDAQYGFDYLKPGMKIEFVNQQSLVTTSYGKIKSVYAVNDRKFIVTLTKPAPTEAAQGYAIAGCDEYPDVHIRGCYFGNNRARGLLLGSRARMLIENNTFHTPGSALLLEGDARGWYEQGGVRNVIIRHNTFDNCNFDNWNRGAIGCGSGINKEHWKESYYNRNLLIEDNTFIIHRTPILYLFSVDGITFRRNKVVATDEQYPCSVDRTKPQELFQLFDCKNFQHDEVEIK